MDEPELKQQLRKLILSNVSEGHSKHLDADYCYIQPSPQTYPFQFWWDSCFHVFICCNIDEYELAKKNMLSLFTMQNEDGFVGHMIFWRQLFPRHFRDVLQSKPTLKEFRPHMSALIQPTFVAQALLRIYEETKDLGFVQKLLPKIKKYHQWLEENRDFEGKGLISIISPFESGMDWKASYDPIVDFKGGNANSILYRKYVFLELQNCLNRYNLSKIYNRNHFIVKDAGFNTIYALDLYALGKLCQITHDEKEKYYLSRAKKVTEQIVELMYDDKEKAFFDIYGKENKKSGAFTPTIFFPIVLPEMPVELSKQIIEKHLFDKNKFQLPYSIPSVSKSEASFNPLQSIFIWRGPTWIFNNWFLYRYLNKNGFNEESEFLLETIIKLIEKSGFREYYNPFSGEGYGATNFTWSGLVWDMIRIRDAKS